MSTITKGSLQIIGVDSDGNRVPIVVDEDGSMLAVVSGENDSGSSVALKVDDNGNLEAIMSGETSGGTVTPVKVTTDGSMEAVLYGDYSGTDKPVLVSSDGRMMADLNLLETLILDFDDYAQGCNHRISLANIGDQDSLIYFTNAYNDLTVIRYINVLGDSSSTGNYIISMGGPDYLGGATSVDETVIDHHQYKKTITDCGFDISTTDCTLTDMIIDINKNIVESSEITHVSGTTLSNSLEEDLSTYDTLTSSGQGETMTEISFPSTSITAVSLEYAPYIDSTGWFGVMPQVKTDGTWTNCTNSTTSPSTLFADRSDKTYNYNISHDNVTGFRIIGNYLHDYAGGITLNNVTITKE